MQTARTGANENIGLPACLAAPATAQRHASGTTHYSPRRGCNAFLRTSIPTIAPQRVTIMDSDENLITRENYEYLRDSYYRYASLLNETPLHDPGQSYGAGIANLYNEMQRLVKDASVNMEAAGERLQFVLWKPNEWGEYNLYWFPAAFIEQLRPQFRRLAITFLHELMKSQQFSPITEWDDTDWMCEWLQESLGEISDQERCKTQDLIASYKTGRIHRLLKRIECCRYYKNLPRALRKHVPADAVERKLLELMVEGLPFIGEDKPSVMDFAYDPFFEESSDFLPIRLDQQIGLVYTHNDLFIEQMVAYLNDSARETYEIVPMTVLYLTPETDCLFAPNDYSTRFCLWADRFITFIRQLL
ncbi:MAG: hypothetical protein NC226_05915 [Bacteroides cellulosilyticus]|nr:hypothetical protein [Bacteroides cellulosilyticus]